MTTHTTSAKAIAKGGFEQQLRNQSPEILNSFFQCHTKLYLTLEVDKEPIQGDDNNIVSTNYLPATALSHLISTVTSGNY